MSSFDEICYDLRAEHEALDAVVAGLGAEDWDTPTPAEGWSVRDQISHLTYFDDRAAFAASDPEGFKSWRDSSAMAELARSDGDPADVALGRAITPEELLVRWRADRNSMLLGFAPMDAKSRIPWFGPDMSATSFVTARLMETWAHGQDVADGLGVTREATDRLRHIVYIGVRALPYAYTVNKRELPTEPLRVEVKSPTGEVWTFGPEEATNVVRGSALDLALVATQRRHRDDTDLVTEGAVADEWLSIAQAFAGPPGAGRKPGQFVR